MEQLKEQKMVYEVLVLRTDQNHIVALESNNYDECFNCWVELTSQWEECAKESKPFQITDPIVTSFSPGMISEIRIVPVTSEEMKSKSHNPYYNQMMQNGFANTFGQGVDMLDQGYKR